MMRQNARFIVASWCLTFFVVLGLLASPVQAADSPDLVFTRTLDKPETVPGEIVTVTFELINHGSEGIDYTLIEEVTDATVVDPLDGGSYNKAVGFIVWRGQVGPGERVFNRYEMRVQAGVQGTLPLYAYLSASNGDVLESFGQLDAYLVPVQLGLQPTLVSVDERSTLSLTLRNPLSKSITVELMVEQASSMRLSQAIPTTVPLEAGEERTWHAEAWASEPGSFGLSVTPIVSGFESGARSQVTLSVDQDEIRRMPKDVEPEVYEPTPAITERTHTVRLPSSSVGESETLLMTVLIPEGAAYLPGTASIGDSADLQFTTEPILRGDYLLFELPHLNYIEVHYSMRYDDESRVALSPDTTAQTDTVGLIAYGGLPRVLSGSSDLLALLSRDLTLPRRERQGVAILYPLDGEVFADRDQTRIEVDAPMDVDVTLFLNGEEVPESQLGGLATDDALGRKAEQYIAVRLESGENRITARGMMPDGVELSDEITVYRSGVVTSVSMQPMTEFVTDSVRPLVLRLTAGDELGLPPADRTPVTVEVSGATILSSDRHPDWVGHQLHFIDGQAFLELESPQEATMVTVTAQLDDVTATESFVVTSTADEWFMIGQGSVRAEMRTGTPTMPPSLTSKLRLFVKGPVGEAVLTGAMDTLGLSESYGGSSIWTGDESAQRSTAGDDGIVYARLERGLSYAQFGRGSVEFESVLTPYRQSHVGLTYQWRENERLMLSGFWAREHVDGFESVFPGDGTRYFRIIADEIKPGSERLSVLTRSATAPHHILRETTIAPGAYRLDYRTGQIFLSEPLLPTNDDGDLLYLRVRYVPEGADPTEEIAGIQSSFQTGLVTWKLMAVRGLPQSGVAPHVAVVGGTAHIGSMELDLEYAASSSDIGMDTATAFSASHPQLLGWGVKLSHRDVGAAFSPIDLTHQGAQKGIVTSLAAERQMGTTRLAASASVARDDGQSPWEADASLGVQWLMGVTRPEVQVKATGGQVTESTMSVRGGIGVDLKNGEVALAREQSIVGSPRTLDTLTGKMDLFEKTSIQASMDVERRGTHQPPRRVVNVGVTQLVDGVSTQLKLQGGYELAADAGMIQSHMVYGAGVNWMLGERHTLSMSLDQKRPLSSSSDPTSGGSLTWTYRADAFDSELRLDHGISASGTKQSLRWSGRIPLGSALTVRTDTLLSVDEANQLRQRVGISGAYRGDRLTVLGSVNSDRLDASFNRTSSTEWWLKSAWRLAPDVSLSAGYARRQTATPTTTDKSHAGIVWYLGERTALQAETSWLRQYDTETTLVGTMLGVSQEIARDLWLTVGYAAADYVGFDLAGDAFSRTRTGLFVELEFAFDETSLFRPFRR